MQRFYADFFVKAAVRLERLQGDAIVLYDEPKKWKAKAKEVVVSLHRQCAKVGPEASLMGQFQSIYERIDARLTGEDNSDVTALLVLLRTLGDSIEHVLAARLFIQVSEERKKWYMEDWPLFGIDPEDDLPLFGLDVERAFPDTTHDLAEAGRCFALERWDACVHHLMVATEHALRKWAKGLNLKTSKPLTLENQQQILDAAEAKRKTLAAGKRTMRRDKTLKYLSETLSQFGFIKDAWRNHSSHGRERYSERSAQNLLNHVEAFMRLLAAKP